MLRLRKYPFAILSVFFGAAPLASCADDGAATADPVAELEAEVCTHLAQGPSAAVTAGADAAQATDISGAHTRWDITLVDDGAGGKHGYVAIASAEATDYALIVTADVDLTFADAAGAAIAAEAEKVGSDVCPAIASTTTVELGVGTYTVHIAGATVATVQLVYVEPGGDAHAHE